MTTYGDGFSASADSIDGSSHLLLEVAGLLYAGRIGGENATLCRVLRSHPEVADIVHRFAEAAKEQYEDAVLLLSAVYTKLSSTSNAYVQADDAAQRARERVLQSANSQGQDIERVKDRLSTATSPGSSVAGIMSEARTEAVYEQKTAEAKDFNANVDKVNEWVERGLTVGTSFMASPAAGAAVSAGYGGLSEIVIQHISRDYTAEANFDAVATYAEGSASHEATLEAMIRHSAQENGYNADQAEEIAASVNREAKQTFGASAVGVHDKE